MAARISPARLRCNHRWKKWLWAVPGGLVALLFFPVPYPEPVALDLEDASGKWRFNRYDRCDRYRIDCGVTTPLIGFAHTIGDDHPFCGRFWTGWNAHSRALAFIREGYGVCLMLKP